MTEAKGKPAGHPSTVRPVVLMTGASGFLGRALCAALAADHELVGLDRKPRDLPNAAGVRCDLTSDESVEEAMRQVKSRYGRRIPPDDFERPARAVVKDMLGGGVNVQWTLALSTILGIGLMCTRLVFGTEGTQADSDHLLGALVVTVSITAMGEAARPARFINILPALALMFAPFMFAGGSLVADLAGVAAGLLLVALSIPRGRIDNPYGGWSRYLV